MCSDRQGMRYTPVGSNSSSPAKQAVTGKVEVTAAVGAIVKQLAPCNASGMLEVPEPGLLGWLHQKGLPWGTPSKLGLCVEALT